MARASHIRRGILSALVLATLSGQAQANKCRNHVFQAAVVAQAFHPVVRSATTLIYGARNFLSGESAAKSPMEYFIVLGLGFYDFQGKVVAEVKGGRSLFIDSLNLCFAGDCSTRGLLVPPATLSATQLPDNFVDLFVSVKQLDPTETNLRELIRLTKPNGEIRFTVPLRSTAAASLDQSLPFLENAEEVEEVTVKASLNPFNGKLVTIKLGDKQ